MSEQRGNAILLRGSFNPKIFQPAWLAAQNLIRAAESETANIQIIHEEVVAFALDWAEIEVRREQLTVNSTPKGETPESVRDLVLGMIQTLDHTPIYAVVIQFFAHYALEDQEARDRLGSTLVPLDPFRDHLTGPGMQTLRVLGRRPDTDEDDPDRVSVLIEPSTQIKPNGVYISVADNYVLADPEDSNVGATDAIQCIEASWSESMRRAAEVSAKVLSLT